jgi:integration host factor subunit alpha
MTKADLADKIHEHLYYLNGSTKKECGDLTDLVFEVMKRAIVEEGKLKVASFGNFAVKQKRTRRGRNPQTGEELDIKARQVLTCEASPVQFYRNISNSSQIGNYRLPKKQVRSCLMMNRLSRH